MDMQLSGDAVAIFFATQSGTMSWAGAGTGGRFEETPNTAGVKLCNQLHSTTLLSELLNPL